MNEYQIEKRPPYYEQFYHSIKKMIFEGKFQPGERINETQLARDFEVSKSPIREAIRVLEKEGLVLVDDKSRVVVYQPTMRDVEEIYFCRMALESFAVGLTVKVASDEELHHVEQTLVKTEKAIQDSQDNNTIIAFNEMFHRLIIEYTQNRRLQKQLNDLRSLMYLFRILNFQGERRAEVILSQHHEIFHHIKNREAELASKAMIAHLEHDLEHLKVVISHSDEIKK